VIDYHYADLLILGKGQSGEATTRVLPIERNGDGVLSAKREWKNSHSRGVCQTVIDADGKPVADMRMELQYASGARMNPKGAIADKLHTQVIWQQQT
jgi:hypothetical protein